ncbi:TPA: replication initiation protein, partial [Streptococcus agalactiae]
MKNNLQALREYQSRVDLSELEKSIYISIDRLTVILDRDNCSLRRIFWELRNSIDSIIQEFSIQANLKEDYFTLYKMINEDSINLIFFQLSTYGGYQVIRLDFNPNSLKEFGGLQVWRQIMNYARLNGLDVRLSRLDLAFDIFNRPEIVFLQHIKGGVSHKIFYGRGGNIESKYWGASGSNV